MATKVLSGLVGVSLVLVTLFGVSCGGAAPEPVPAPAPAPTPAPAPAPQPEPSLPQGFVKSGDFALAAVGFWEKSYPSGEKIMAVVAVRKLSPAVEDAFSSSIEKYWFGEIELISDQGETWKSSIRGWPGPSINMKALPKDFTFILDVYTEAPAIALGHIAAIRLNGQEVPLVDFKIGSLEETGQLVPFGRQVSVGKWLSIKPIRATFKVSSESLTRIYLDVEVQNSSYDNKSYLLKGAFQTEDGRIYGAFSTYLSAVAGKSSIVDSLILEEWNMGQPLIPRIYIVYANETQSPPEYPKARLLIVRPSQ